MKWIAVTVVSLVVLAAALLFTGNIEVLSELLSAVGGFGN